LYEKIREHQTYLRESGEFEKRRKRQVKREIYQHLEERLLEEVNRRIGGELKLEEMIDEISSGESDPFTKATEIFDKYFK